MSKYGQPYSAGYGNPENHVKSIRVVDKQAYYDVYFTPATNLGGAFFSIARSAKLVAKAYATEGIERGPLAVSKLLGVTPDSLLILRDGQIADPWYVNPFVLRAFESSVSRKVTLAWPWQPEIIGSPDGIATNWVLSGITYAGTERIVDQPTRGRLSFDTETSGGNVTVTVRAGTTVVASGTGAYPGVITLTGTYAGSVSMSMFAGTAVGLPLYIRWPATMAIKRGTVDPPTVTVATVKFNARDTIEWTEPTDLTANTYYYRGVPTSDTGTAGTASVTATAVVNGPPAAPTLLAYSSGNAAATVLSFKASLTAGATYRAYTRKIGAAFIDLNNVAATAIAASPGSNHTITLPAIVGSPGTIQVLVRAVNGVYPTQNEGTAATTLQLFKRTPSGVGSAYNFLTPDATATLGAANAQGLKQASLNFTFASNGLFYVTLKAVTAGGVQSTDYAPEILIDSNDGAPVATTITAYVSRG